MKTKNPKKKKSRQRRAQIVKLLGGCDGSPLLWLLNRQLGDETTASRIDCWYRELLLAESVADKKRQVCIEEIGEELASASLVDPPGQTELLALAAAQCFPILDLPSGEFEPSELKLTPIRNRLFDLIESDTAEQNPAASNAWRTQMLQVELPLTLLFQVAPIDNEFDLQDDATSKFSELVDELLDHDGWPHARDLPIFGSLMASWSRSLALVKAMELEMHPDTESQLEWAFRQLLRLLRADRTLVFDGFKSPPVTDECLRLMSKMSSDLDDRKLLKRCLTKATSGIKKRKKSSRSKGWPQASTISEWGLSGLLQSHWAQGSPKVGFDFSNRSFAIEVGAAKTLVSGSAMPKILVDGNEVTPLDDFEIVCEEQDHDVDYVEFQMALTDGVTLNRQLILSRHEEFLLIADCVVPVVPGRIEYECAWPLAPGISGIHETETREVYLQDRKIRSLVLPLSLPEWKVGPSGGRLELDNERLLLSDSEIGAGLYVPVLFDLNPKRSKRKRTWRQLTVGEDRRPVRRDVAAAFRFQLHKQQWFFYRVVSSSGNRTFLGENFNGEFVFNRFSEDGAVDELLCIE